MPFVSNSLLRLVLFVGLCSLLALYNISYAKADRAVYHIKVQTLGEALIRFSEVSGLQFIYKDASIAQIAANEVIGNLTSTQALKLLLWGTGYSFEFIDDKVIRIYPTQIALGNEDNQNSQQTNEHKPMEELVLLGTRVKNYRHVLDSPVPVNIINADALAKQSFSDMSESLRTLLPSFSVFTFPGSDGSSLVRPVTFRSLPPDQILVLINGKRRHRSALVNLIGGGFNPLSLGAQGVDFATIPNIAVKRIEILHDGSAAQYGSDAIAGVINFILNDYDQGSEIRTQYGKYYVGDGENIQLQTNFGMPMSDDGFFNLSFEYVDSGYTSRGTQRPDVLELIEQGYDIPDPAQRWGNADVESFKGFWNGSAVIGANMEAYFYGNYEHRDTLTGFFFRHPFSAAYRQSQYDPDYDLRDRFPNGFTPEFGAIVTDFSQVAGVSGELNSGLDWDLSMRYAGNKIDYRIHNTVNLSMGAESPTRFKPGSLSNHENGLNFDISYPIKASGDWKSLNLASGFEYRNEEYVIGVGDPASYTEGPLRDLPIGSNGFPGYAPNQAGSYSRQNLAAYIDFEAEVSERFMYNIAGRYEHYTDFGEAWAGKLASRYKFNAYFALRGSYSTGFRAPTAGQSTTINTSTNFSPGNPMPVVRATFPPSHPASEYFGAKPLTAETSDNFAGGFVFTPQPNFSLTVDFYRIRVDDRIGLSGNFLVSEEDRGVLETLGVRDARTLESIRYFTNSFNTETTGADIVAAYDAEWDASRTQFSLGINLNRQKLRAFDPAVIQREREIELQQGFPDTLLNFSVLHDLSSLSILFRSTYYGDFVDAAAEPMNDVRIGSEWVFDFELSYRLNHYFEMTMGARNIFDNYPDKTDQFASFGLPYSHQSPFGFNGGFWYLRAVINY